jgi:tetratricopeptide (TPR) repeat protein
MGLVQVGSQAHADRYTYLPQIGLYFLLTWTAAELCAGSRALRMALGVVAIAALAVLTLYARVQVGYWQDSQSLWRHAVACTPSNIIAHGNLADALMQKGKTAEASVQYRRVLKLQPENPQAQFGLGLALAREGRISDAIALFKEALKSDYPPGRTPLNQLASILASSPDPDLRNGTQAVEFAQQADLLSGGTDPAILDTLAAAYAEAGRGQEAVQTAQRALALATEQGNDGLAQDLRRKIELYQTGHPYHKPQ